MVFWAVLKSIWKPLIGASVKDSLIEWVLLGLRAAILYKWSVATQTTDCFWITGKILKTVFLFCIIYLLNFL